MITFGFLGAKCFSKIFTYINLFNFYHNPKKKKIYLKMKKLCSDCFVNSRPKDTKRNINTCNLALASVLTSTNTALLKFIIKHCLF